jgi:carbonic anhydrase
VTIEESAAGKMNSVVIALVLLFANCNKFSVAAVWDYGLNGPLRWGANFPTCKGLEQSPININTATAVSSKQPAFVFNYPATADFILRNNGHSAEMRVTSASASVTGGDLEGKYILEQFHVHWGKTNAAGSEHKLDGKQFPMEIHFVHYSEKFANVSMAVASGQRRALAVLGVFVDVTDGREAKDLGILARMLRSIPYRGNTVAVKEISVLNLFPASWGRFYRYDGSLTTPSCNEVVVWTVFNDPIYISGERLALFRGLRESLADEAEEVFIEENFRPTQPLGARTVNKSQ